MAWVSVCAPDLCRCGWGLRVPALDPAPPTPAPHLGQALQLVRQAGVGVQRKIQLRHGDLLSLAVQYHNICIMRCFA